MLPDYNSADVIRWLNTLFILPAFSLAVILQGKELASLKVSECTFSCLNISERCNFLFIVGSMVAFGMRLLHAELPHHLGRSQETLDRLYYILAVTQKVNI